MQEAFLQMIEARNSLIIKEDMYSKLDDLNQDQLKNILSRINLGANTP